MKKFKNTWNKVVYNLSTEDRYAGYNSQQKEAESPYQTRLANGSSAYINAALTEYPEESMNSTDDFHDNVNKDLSNGEGVQEVALAWKHMHMWASKYQPDLYDTLSLPCTRRDLLLAQRDLKLTLPKCVIDSLLIHDGQDVMPDSHGFVFGLELMDLDSIVKMTNMWRKVSERLHNTEARKIMMSKIDNMSQPQLIHASSSNLTQMSKLNNLRLQELSNNNNRNPPMTNNYKTEVPKQSSVPTGAVTPTYANLNWIPLLTDNAGNHIGVDLGPGRKGKWGQVIIFGRDFDTKFVVAPNWGDFLLIFANDLESHNWRIEGDDDDMVNNGGEVIFNDYHTGKDREYLTVLKERCLIKYQSQLLLEKKESKLLANVARTPDLIDTRSPIVNEVEVFPDNETNVAAQRIIDTADQESDTEVVIKSKDGLDEVIL